MCVCARECVQQGVVRTAMWRGLLRGAGLFWGDEKLHYGDGCTTLRIY